MLDDLLGKTELKEEIATLKEDNSRLESRLEKESQRRKNAVTERQEAQRRANKLEDRIEQLEDRVKRLQSDDPGLRFSRETELRGTRLTEVLNRIESFETGPEAALTAFVGDGTNLPRELREVLGERAALVSRAAPCLTLADDAGLLSVCIRPPVTPDSFVEWDSQFTLDRNWLEPRGEYTLALVRSDLFAMGTYDGADRTAFHGFDSQLKSQHSKGGFSQARFARLRDEQIDDHLKRCQAALAERETDRLYVVGERSILGEFMSMADGTATVDATGKPEPALTDAWRDFWTTRLYVL